MFRTLPGSKSIRTRVRLLLGSESPPAFRAAATAAARAIPDAVLVEVGGQGHGMIDADPDGFVALVVEFFAATDSKAGTCQTSGIG